MFKHSLCYELNKYPNLTSPIKIKECELDLIFIPLFSG